MEFPQSKVLATDISERALDIAEQNDIIHEGRVEFLKADLIGGLVKEVREEAGRRNLQMYSPELKTQDYDYVDDGSEEPDWFEDLQFDVVVANLPYVDPGWEWLDTEALDYEPKTALYVRDENGLGLYRRFFRELKELKTHYVAIEADPCQHTALVKMAEEFGWGCQKIEGFALLFVRRF